MIVRSIAESVYFYRLVMINKVTNQRMNAINICLTSKETKG